MQVLTTLIASLIIEKVGRKKLLLVSVSAVAVNSAILGIYFSVKTRLHVHKDIFSDMAFIPIGAVCLFVLAFSLGKCWCGTPKLILNYLVIMAGLGPIPWMIASEIVPTEIRSKVGSAAGTFNWCLAFVVTKSYLSLYRILGDDSMFYSFAVLSSIGAIFIIFMLPETKGKSVAEIQEELNH